MVHGFSVKPDKTTDKDSKRGENFEKNRRPDSCKRVTFALGAKAQEQSDRLARVLSIYRKGGVSQSALIRTLLEFAETAALESGDATVKSVFDHSEGSPSPSRKPNPESARIWKAICSEIRKP
jgi:hypothetical protein